jgi:outer membrane protein
VEWAKEHNISLQQSRINETIAGYDLESAQAQWQPTLDFATTHGYTNTPFGKGNKNSYNSSYGLNAGWTVWNGGIRENNIKRSKISTEIDRLNTEEILRGIETDLLSVYINILYARESISIYEEAVELSKAQADRARQLMEAGRLSKVDYAQLESQYEQDRYNLVNAKGTYDNRRMELKTLLQLGINDNITLQDVTWTREQVMAELPDIDDSYKLAIQTDKKIQALKLSDEQADLDIAIAKGGRMPNISLSAGVGTGYYAPGGAFGTQMKQSINESVGLTFSVPILDNKKNKTAIAKAKAQQLNAQLDIDSRYNDIARNVETWYIDLRAAQSRYAAGEEQVKSTTLSNDLVNEQFKLGLVNTVELMTAHNNLLEARHSLLQAKYMAMLGHKMIEFYRTATITMP